MSKLELTWIGKENRPRSEPRIRFEDLGQPQQASSTGTCYEGIVKACAEPTCSCCNILVQCQSVLPDSAATSSDSTCEFWLDVWEKSVVMTPELEKDPDASRLANAIRAELADRDWEELYQWFRVTKLEIIQTAPLSEIETKNLPSADGGRMVGFVEVFPWGLALNLPFQGELWAVDEQYCVQPKCDCKETVLTFLKYEDATGRKLISPKAPPAVRYNYRSEATTEVAPPPTGGPATGVLLAALKGAYPSLNHELELRHLILQSLYARHYLAEAQSALHSRLTHPAPAAANKIGRNEPCPCGSGKKYKH